VTANLTSPASVAKRLPLSWLLRLTVSGLALALIFRIVPLEQVWNEARRLPPLLWFSALGFFLAGHLAATAKWRLLIGEGVSFMQAFQAHLAGLAANLCLPGLAGGDIVRAALVFRSAKDHSLLIVGSVADRIVDILGLLLYAAVAGLVLWRTGQNVHAQILWPLLAAVVGLLVLFPACLLLESAVRRANFSSRPGRVFSRAVFAISYLVHRPARLTLCLAISMAVQATFIAINIAFAAAVQVQAPIAGWFFAWSAAKIIAIAPISLGGLGVREAVMAGLLAPLGANPAQVIAIGLIWQTVLYVSGLIGILAQFVWNPDAAKTADRAEAETAAQRPS
jgi:uncharacterized membrane protein YbhN (UPF0104 family)